MALFYQVMLKYGVPNYNDVNEFLQMLAHRKGLLQKGGVPKIDLAAKKVLHDWNE